MFGKYNHLPAGIKAFLLVCLFLNAVIYVTRDPMPLINTYTPLNITDRDHIYINGREIKHLSCIDYGIDEDVIATRNPEHYLQYTIQGEIKKGGSLVVDLTQTQSRLSTTICGHNFDEPGTKFSEIANVWECTPSTAPSILYFDGEKAKRYTLLGSFKIDAEEVGLAYPSLDNTEDILIYLNQLKGHEGWINESAEERVENLIILLTCTEALRNAPHRTILIFAS